MHSASNNSTAQPRTPERKLRRREASTYLQETHGVPAALKTLERLAHTGGGPRFYKAGRFPLYPISELDRWAEARLGRLVASTSEVTAPEPA